MAIIKHLKRLGATILGAKSGNICVFDTDGNVIDSGRGSSAYLPAITTATRGKFLRVKTNTNSAEWTDVPSDLPATEAGDAGKILSVNDQLDPQWVNLLEDVTAKLSTEAIVSIGHLSGYKLGNLIIIYAHLTNASGTDAIAAGTPFMSVDESIRPPVVAYVYSSRGGVTCSAATGTVQSGSSIAASQTITFTMIYPIA